MRARSLVLSSCLLLCVACGRSALDADAGTPGVRPADAGRDAGVDAGLDAGSFHGRVDAGPACSVCPCPDAGVACGLTPLVDPSVLCASPRPDADAEWLVIEATGHFVADQALYERVHQDLVTIRTARPELARITAVMSIRGGVLAAGDPQVVLDTPEFDCFLRTYRGHVTYAWSPPVPWLAVEFEPAMDVNQLLPQLLQLPGIGLAEVGGFIDTPDLCLSFTGDTATYIFDAAGGDCPSGCTTHTFSGFTSEADGGVTALGDWTPGTAPTPGWYRDASRCWIHL